MKKSFHLLWVSQLFANLGDVFYIVGLISILYHASESVFWLALLPFVNMTGRMISSSFAPLLFNRYKLKTVLVFSQAGKTMLLVLLVTGILHHEWLYALFSLVFTIALLDGVAQPASAALLPRIVDKSKLLRANSVLSMINDSTQLGGWALGGLLVVVLDGQSVIALTFILYILSTCCMAFIVDKTPLEKNITRSKWQELTEGFRIIITTPPYRAIHIVLVAESIANVVWVAAIMYIFVADVLHVSEAWWGYLNATFFIGFIIGGFVCTKFENQLNEKMKDTIIVCSFSVAILLIVFGFNNLAVIALLISLAYGVFEQIKGIVITTFLQKEASDEQLVKIYSAQGVIVSFVFGVSILIAGAAANVLSVQWLYIVAGVILLGAAIYFLSVRNLIK